jgi:hypothetical protein
LDILFPTKWWSAWLVFSPPMLVRQGFLPCMAPYEISSEHDFSYIVKKNEFDHPCVFLDHHETWWNCMKIKQYITNLVSRLSETKLQYWANLLTSWQPQRRRW